MKYFKKILNPFIFIINFMNYSSHLETHRHSKSYTPYNFNKDLKYF